MPLLDKLPEATTAAPATPTAPTEGGVSAETVTQGQKLETRQELGALAQEVSQAQAEAHVETAATTIVPGTATQETPKTGWAGFMNNLSSGWSKISEWFGDAGKKIGDWIKDLRGIKDKAGDKAKETAEGLVDKAKEAVYKLTELLDPHAPVFTFLSGKMPRVTSKYGNRDDPMDPGHEQNHKGIDITLGAGDTDVGEPIVATRPLVVKKVQKSEKGGNEIILEDTENPGTTYGFSHLETLPDFESGAVLPAGTLIAKIGNTGSRMKGAHLHFSTKQNGQFVDPSRYTGLA